MLRKAPAGIIASAAIVLIAAAVYALLPRPPVILKARIDRTHMSVGTTVRYVVTVSVLDGISVEGPDVESAVKGWTVKERASARAHPHGRIETVYTYMLTSYEPGVYPVGPVCVRYRMPHSMEWHSVYARASDVAVVTLLGYDSGRRGRITIGGGLSAKALQMKEGADSPGGGVRTMDIDIPSVYSIEDDRGPKNITTLFDIITIGIIAIAGSILLAAGGVYAYRKISSGLRRPPSASERALGRLSDISSERYCRYGQEKEFYGLLSVIAKDYCVERFGMPRGSTTLKEFLHEIDVVGALSQQQKDMICMVLRIYEHMKFSPHMPTREEMEESIAGLRAFIKETSGLLT